MIKKIASGVTLLTVVVLSASFYFQSTAKHEIAGAVSLDNNQAALLNLPSINRPGQGKIWVCPMHPEIIQGQPGSCPICGMDLVEAKNHEDHDHSLHIDSASLQKLGVRLARVKKSTLSQDLLNYGNVVADANTIFAIHSKFDGWIRSSHIHSVGQKIEQGQLIYEIYSPELIMQQKEYLRFIERRNQILQSIGDSRFEENQYVMDLLTELSRERTKFIYENVSPQSVQSFEDSKMPVDIVKIVAEKSGIVTQINVREGSYITPSVTLFTVASTSRVWVEIPLYSDQIEQVRVGDAVTISTQNGSKFNSRIEFISPVAENNKASARVVLDNSQLHLRVGSFVDATIHTKPHQALVLPRSAVIRTGAGERVMLSRGEGHFLPVMVETGIESGEEIEITEGLLEEAEVAVNGQFLLDAAASLNSAAQRMQPSPSHQ